MLDFNIAERIQCSWAEKQELLLMIQHIMAMSHLSRRRGLLCLEEVLHRVPEQIPFFLGKGIEMVIDGIEAEEIAGVLDRYIMAGNYTGMELLSRLILKDGILLIQKGANQNLTGENLIAWLGEEFYAEIDREALREAADSCEPFGFQELNRASEGPMPSPLGELLERVEDLLGFGNLADALNNIDARTAALFLALLFQEEGKKQKLLDSLSSSKREAIAAEDIGSAVIAEAAEAVSAVVDFVISGEF